MKTTWEAYGIKWGYEVEALKKLKSMGMVVSAPSKQHLPLRNAILEALPWVEWYAKKRKNSPHLIYIYPFRREGQFAAIDGLCTTFYDDGTATIGLAEDVVTGDYDYLCLCLLHEAAHLKITGHGADFVRWLDRIIFEFNKRTGAELKPDLDYLGLYLDDDGHPIFSADGRAWFVA